MPQRAEKRNQATPPIQLRRVLAVVSGFLVRTGAVCCPRCSGSVPVVVNTPPVVARTTWTEADYGTMSWHDNAVHAIAWEPLPDNPGRLLLDIDCILQWVAP